MAPFTIIQEIRLEKAKKDVEIIFTKTSELILIDCIDWSKRITNEKNWGDNLGVGIFKRIRKLAKI